MILLFFMENQLKNDQENTLVNELLLLKYQVLKSLMVLAISDCIDLLYKKFASLNLFL